MKAERVLDLYQRRWNGQKPGPDEYVTSSDEKTSMQILGRPYPTQPAQPGKPEKREADYERHGTRVLMTTFCVPLCS